MGKKENQQFYVPSTSSTIFEFQVNSKPDKKVNILVEKTDESFSIIETGTGKKILIGSLIDLMKYLNKASGRWLVRKKTKTIPKRLFFNREFCEFLLGLGYTMIHVQTGLAWVWNNDYRELIVSDGSIRTEDQIPPSGTFAIYFCQERKIKTKKDVEAERQRAMEAEAKLREETERQAREAERKAARQQELERRNGQQNETNEPEGLFSWKDLGWFGAASAFIFGGLGLGIGLCISKK